MTINNIVRKVKSYYVILFLLAFLFSQTVFAAITITNIRVSKSTSKPRVVLELSKEPKNYKIFTIHNPERLVLDIKRAKLKTNLTKVTNNALFTKVRGGIRKGHDYRIVFDLRVPVDGKAFLLSKTKTKPVRLVIDILAKKPVLAKKTKLIYKKNKPIINKIKTRDIIVVIDPGHGGRDPGATGPAGTHEKTVVLAIAKDLYKLIQKTPGMRAVMTRKGDYYIGLRQRLNFARKYKADMFVSIHADAFKNKKAKGASVFALSLRGASSEAARWLAEKENSSELVGGVNLNDKSNILRSVLLDLSQTATIRSSLTIGSAVLKALGKFARLHHHKVEQAGFVVLKSPDIPSILVETGFLSNPIEERRLKTKRYQRKLSRALLAGIKQYFATHSPPDTWFAARHTLHYYRVKSGDSLSKIAWRYDVSERKLARFNGLRRSRLRIGQVLKIPPINQSLHVSASRR